jgi:polar amino acid transport system substrate-binding protein
MKKIIMIVMAMLLSLTFIACQNNKNLNTIKVLTSSGYEPYEMVDSSGKLIGFDIELMEALASEVGVEIEWIDVDFKGIIASLQAKTADAAIAGISPNDERREMVDFSNLYYSDLAGLSNQLIYKDGNNYSSYAELAGLTVGAQMGTVQAELIESIKDEYGFTVELRESNSQVIEEIKTNRIDVLVVEGAVAESIIEANSTLTNMQIDNVLDQDQGIAIAFTKDSIWTEKFNIALETLKQNGILQNLIDKWLVE